MTEKLKKIKFLLKILRISLKKASQCLTFSGTGLQFEVNNENKFTQKYRILFGAYKKGCIFAALNKYAAMIQNIANSLILSIILLWEQDGK
ncbi:MAG: hypothetical protein LBU37_02860 [Tannerellaceae bacterium]|nr:hypothetical protein [Tannerellaceae bacterium]